MGKITVSCIAKVEPLWKGQESLTKVAKIGPFRRTILYKSIMFVYPPMIGHLFWKATILGGFYRGVPLYIRQGIYINKKKRFYFCKYRTNGYAIKTF